MCLFGFLKHWAGSRNRRSDPNVMGLCVGCRVFRHLSNKTIPTKNKGGVKYEVFLNFTTPGVAQEGV